MDSRNTVIKETAILALGEGILSAATVGIFTLLGQFQWNVLWGAAAGCAVIVLNYFFMAVTVSLAADRAAQGSPKAGQNMIQVSSVLRLILMGGALLLGIKLGANVIALVLPLAFQRPILMLAEFFRKKGDVWTESK